MDNLEKKVRLRIQDIVEKLQKLDCTLLGNKDDAWIMELLFRPGFHRYHLIEWLLSKLGYDIEKMSRPQTSVEERMRNLQSTISDLGVCRQNSHYVIKGTAEVKEQLEFWCTLIDLVWLKHEITLNSSIAEADQARALSPEKRDCINEKFEKSYSSVSKICDAVTIRELFEQNFELLAPDVERETKNMSKAKSPKFPTLQDVLNIVKQLVPDPLERYNLQLFNDMPIDETKDTAIIKTELNESEQQLRNVSVDLQNNAQKNFSSTYNDLKPLISQVKNDEFTDVGESFKKLEPHLESFSQLEKSLPQLISSQSKISQLTSDLNNLQVKESLADKTYEDSLKLLKDEN